MSFNSIHKLLILLAAVAVCSVHPLFAETEVSGEVSGVWDREGSPYIVVDTLIILTGQSLSIDEGVSVQIYQDVPFLVQGRISAIGSSDLPVEFSGYENSIWYGFTFSDNRRNSSFNHCTISDCANSFDFYNSATLYLSNCIVNSTNTVLQTSHRYSARVIADSCEMSCDSSYFIYLNNIEFIARDCVFQRNLYGEMSGSDCSLDLTNCVYFGSINIFIGILSLDGVEIPFVERGSQVRGDGVTGEITNCQIDSEIRIECAGGEFDILESTFNNRFRIYNFSGSFVRDEFSCFPPDYVRISDGDCSLSHISGNNIQIWDSRVTIDSCEIVSLELRSNELADIYDNIFIEELYIYGEGEYSVHNNRIIGELKVSNTQTAEIFQNEISAEITIRYAFANIFRNNIASLGYNTNRNIFSITLSNPIISSNIILKEQRVNLFDVTTSDNYTETIRYNCIWGYNRRPDITSLYDLSIDTTNFIADPLIRGYDPIDFELQPVSPCIDAGDPELGIDQDFTYKEIGAETYDHQLDQDPAIHSEDFTIAKRGIDFSYIAKGNDDHSVEIRFRNLPEWLRRGLRRDTDINEVILQGRVPIDQDDFSFSIIATDNSNQYSIMDINVITTDLTPIKGAMSGILKKDNSPYLVYDNLFIEEGETLEIEPGCRLYFHNEGFNFGSQLKIVAYGELLMNGTDEDSIAFLPFSLDNEDRWGGIYICSEEMDQCYEYISLIEAERPINIENTRDFTIRHSSLFRSDSLGNLIDIDKSINVNIIKCSFKGGVVGVSLDSDNVNIIASRFINNYVYIAHSEKAYFERDYFFCSKRGIAAPNVDTLMITRCTFDRSGIAYHSNGEYTEIINCTAFDPGILPLLVPYVYICNCTFTTLKERLYLVYKEEDNDVLIEYSNFQGYRNIANGEIFRGDGIIFSDPQFIDPFNSNFWIRESSPLIDAGNPGSPLDPDSSRADIGAFFWTIDSCSSVSEIESDNARGIEIFTTPNPTNSSVYLHIKTIKEEICIVNIYDMLGKSIYVKEYNLNRGENVLSFNLKGYPSGSYLVTVNHCGEIFAGRFTVLR